MAVDTKAPERIEWEYTGHYGHNDPKGTAGANCPACQADRRNHERFAALQKRYEEAMEALRAIRAAYTDDTHGGELMSSPLEDEMNGIALALLQRHKEGV